MQKDKNENANSHKKQLVKTSNEKKKMGQGNRLRLSGKVSFDDLRFEKKLGS